MSWCFVSEPARKSSPKWLIMALGLLYNYQALGPVLGCYFLRIDCELIDYEFLCMM